MSSTRCTFGRSLSGRTSTLAAHRSRRRGRACPHIAHTTLHTLVVVAEKPTRNIPRSAVTAATSTP